MLFKSQLLTQASGSIGGVTASHNKGGMYFRARTIPTDPSTNFQQTMRSAMAQLSNLWVNSLSQAQRDAWDLYALLVPLSNPFGDLKKVSGLNQYVRSNTVRLQAGLTRVDDAPTVYDQGDFTAVINAVDATAQEIDVAFGSSQDWIDEDGSGLLVYVSRGQNPSVNFLIGPYRLAGTIAGSSTTPPTSPTSLSLPFPVTAGQAVFAKLQVSRADGRLSAPFRQRSIAA